MAAGCIFIFSASSLIVMLSPTVITLMVSSGSTGLGSGLIKRPAFFAFFSAAAPSSS